MRKPCFISLEKLFLLLAFYLSFVALYPQRVDSVFWQEVDAKNDLVIELSYINLDSALFLSSELLRNIRYPIDTIIRSRILMTHGHIHFDKGDMETANKYYLETLELRELKKDPGAVSSSLISLANLQYYTKSYNKARELSLKALKKNKEAKSNGYKFAQCYNLIGLTYYHQNNEDSAMYYYKKGIACLEKDENSVSDDYLQLYDNIGAALIWQKDYKQGNYYIKKNLQHYKNTNNKLALSWKFNQLSNSYLNWGKLDSTKKYLDLGLKLTSESTPLETKKDIYYTRVLYAIRVHLKDSILYYLNEYTDLSNKILIKKTQKNIQEAEAKYQSEKNKAALALSKEREAVAKAENKTSNLYLSMALIGLIVLGLTSFYTLRNSRQKRQITEMKLDIKDIEMKNLMSNQESESFAAMLKGQEEERERIAQDLHDRLGGTLAALKHSLRRPENKVEEEDLNIIDEAVVEVRDIAHNLSSGLLEKQGLNVALEQLKHSIERSGQIVFNLYLHSSMAELGQEVALELYRIVQELTNNTLKHAQASEISLQTSMNDQTFNLIFEDNGIGFDPNTVNGGIGLHNLKARVKKINGNLHIDSGEGRGTISIVELELKA